MVLQDEVPIEILEEMLIKAFLFLYLTDIDGDDDRFPHKSGRSAATERRAFTLLSSVCFHWHQTLIGWPQSRTRLWTKHQIKKEIDRELYAVVYRITYVFILIINS